MLENDLRASRANYKGINAGMAHVAKTSFKVSNLNSTCPAVVLKLSYYLSIQKAFVLSSFSVVGTSSGRTLALV